MKDKIKELTSDNVLMSAYLLLEDAKQLKASLALELQAVRDDRRAELREFQEYMAELRDSLTKIQAQFKIEAQLLNLIGSQKAGEEGWQKENNSNRCRTLDALSKKTR